MENNISDVTKRLEKVAGSSKKNIEEATKILEGAKSTPDKDAVFRDLQKRLTQLEKNNNILTIHIQSILEYLYRKTIFKRNSYQNQFDKIKYQVMGFVNKETGANIEENDYLICEIWWEDGKERKDFRSYTNIPLILNRNSFTDFKELLTLIGRKLHLGKIYELTREIPKEYPKNLPIAGKTLNYKVKIIKCLSQIKGKSND